MFGRSATYDTADDAIVRVTASDVRKPLLQHYGNTGAHSKFRINLPSGSYVPEFCLIPASALGSLDIPVIVRPAPDIELVPHPMPPNNPRPWFRSWRAPAAAALLICILIGASWAVRRWVLTSGSSDSLNVAAFQGMPHTAQVIVADDALVLIQALLDRRFTLEEYENLTYMNVPELALKKDLLRFWSSNHSPGSSNACQVFLLWKLRHPRQFALQPLGGPVPRGRVEFSLRRTTAAGQARDHTEPPSPARRAREGRSPSGYQSMSATEMAGELLLRKDSTAHVRRMLGLPPADRLPDLEMVLRVSEQNEIGDSVEVVACRKVIPHIE